MGSPGETMEQSSLATLWISLLNTVFASIAFMVWYLVKAEEKQARPTARTVDHVNIVETLEAEEEAADPVTNEEKHLYIQPSLRTDNNILNYTEYCVYDTKPQKNVKFPEEQYKEIKPESVTNPMIPTLASREPFQWPRNDDIIENLRSMRTQRPEISSELKCRLASHGILRQEDDQEDNQEENQEAGMRLVDTARALGRQVPKKQVCVVWDVFQATSRPGLEHSSPDTSPSPRTRKPLKIAKRKEQGAFTMNIKPQHGENLIRAM